MTITILSLKDHYKRDISTRERNLEFDTLILEKNAISPDQH